MIACICGGVVEAGLIAGAVALVTKLIHWWNTRGWMAYALTCEHCGSMEPECPCGESFICDRCGVRHEANFGCSDDQWRSCDDCWEPA